MSDAVTSYTGYQRAVEDLVEKLRHAYRSFSESPERHSPVIRLETEVEPVDILTWLAAQRADSKIYWRDRDGLFETAGLGIADLVSSSASLDFNEIVRRVRGKLSGTAERMRYYGGFRFDAPHCEGRRDPSWEPFGSCRLNLPRIELTNDGDRHLLACNILTEDFDQQSLDGLIKELKVLSFSPHSLDSLSSHPLSRSHAPDKANWTQNIDSAIDSFAALRAKKIVLARRSAFDFSSHLQPWLLLDRLRSTSVVCFLFGFQPEEGTAFVGATPERLYRRRADKLESEAVAGTRPRGSTEKEDARLAGELLDSDKERREHNLVVDSIEASLGSLCSQLSIAKGPITLKLARVQHLKTTLAGRLLPDVTDGDILGSLHPTAAVSGFPADSARREIERLEPFDRGWYAGPIGWINPGGADFAVAIRSGLVTGKRLSLFSGAGIVDGSTADGEWEEIDNKISNFIRAITGQNK